MLTPYAIILVTVGTSYFVVLLTAVYLQHDSSSTLFRSPRSTFVCSSYPQLRDLLVKLDHVTKQTSEVNISCLALTTEGGTFKSYCVYYKRTVLFWCQYLCLHNTLW